MKTPVITVKKVSTFQGHDGIGVNADVYIDGIYVGHFYDDAHGGGPEFTRAIYMDDKAKDNLVKSLLFDLDAYAKSLPSKDLNADKSMGQEPMMIQQDDISLMDDIINAELGKKEKAKFARQFEKHSLTGILYGTADHYGRVVFKTPLAQLVQNPSGKAALQTRVNITKLELKKGETILNKEYLKSLGITIP
jgi:hypothetical protein